MTWWAWFLAGMAVSVLLVAFAAMLAFVAGLESTEHGGELRFDTPGAREALGTPDAPPRDASDVEPRLFEKWRR